MLIAFVLIPLLTVLALVLYFFGVSRLLLALGKMYGELFFIFTPYVQAVAKGVPDRPGLTFFLRLLAFLTVALLLVAFLLP